jgi:hypothetical protein
LVLAPWALVARRDDAPLRVQEEDRARADLLAEGGEAGVGLGVLAQAQRLDQDRVARQQQRHDGVALERALEAARVERRAHRGVVALVLAEGAREVDAAAPDHQRHQQERDQEAQPQP